MSDTELGGWSVSHLVGPEVALGTLWLRQRCAWCGALLVDRALGGQEPEENDIWEPGSTLRHDENDHWQVIPFDEEHDLLPEDSCMEWPVTMTGSAGPGPGPKIGPEG